MGRILVRRGRRVKLEVDEAQQFFSSKDCKIFNSLQLWWPDRQVARQNLEPEGLTRKIFGNKELAGGLGPLFRAGLRKVLDWLKLRSEGRVLWLQNIAE
jgi:hypothetical protein